MQSRNLTSKWSYEKGNRSNERLNLWAFLIRIITASVLTISMACAPTRMQVKLPPERSYHNGFSLTPLNEEGCHISENDKGKLHLGRHGSRRDETYVIYARVLKLPPFDSQSEFIDFVKRRIKGYGEKRFNNIKEEVAPCSRNGDHCVRSYVMYEDKVQIKC